MDYLNGNVRVFYDQGRQTQQSFIYVNVRVDEFGSDKTRVNRTECTWATDQYVEKNNKPDTNDKYGEIYIAVPN